MKFEEESWEIDYSIVGFLYSLSSHDAADNFEKEFVACVTACFLAIN